MQLLPLCDYNEDLRKEVGNKAANASILYRAGFPVPEGIVMTASYVNEYPKWVNDFSLAKRIYESLGPPLVVRSSAIGEDSDGQSFAGIFESRLNLRNFEQYKKAIDEVISSASSQIAESYAGNKSRTNMALLIQRMVSAEVSGVLFTANPITGNKDEMVLEYFNGLGPSVVSGKVSPNSVVINKKGLIIKAINYVDSGIGYFEREEGGLDERHVGYKEVIHMEPALIKEISCMALEIESLLGKPQDVEWSMARGRFYILQSRPITTV